MKMRFDRLYDLYRSCILNSLYYSRRQQLSVRIGEWLDYIVFLGSGTSGVSGWVIWTKYPDMGGVWAVIAGLSTLVAGLKPLMKLDARKR